MVELIAIQSAETDLGQIAPGNCMKCDATERKHDIYQTGNSNIARIQLLTGPDYLVFSPHVYRVISECQSAQLFAH